MMCSYFYDKFFAKGVYAWELGSKVSFEIEIPHIYELLRGNVIPIPRLHCSKELKAVGESVVATVDVGNHLEILVISKDKFGILSHEGLE